MSSFKETYQKLNSKPAMKVLKSLGALIIIIIVFALINDAGRATAKFLTVNNILTITLQMSIYALLALGICYVLLIGGAELSAGSIVGVTAMTFLVLMREGLPFPVSLIITIIMGLVIGFLNGFMVAKMKMIPFVATLGMQYVARGFCQIIGNGQTIALTTAVKDEGLLAAFRFIGSGRVLGTIPMATIVVVIFFIIHYIILNHRSFGRKVYAVGSNSEAARLSGIKADRIVIMAYMISSFMATMAGLLYTMRLSIAQPAGGDGWEFEGIAACVIGGISMMGGEGSVVGAIIGASTLAVMRNGMNQAGLNPYWQNVVTGLVIVGAVYMDIRRRQKEATRL
ncbi:MAG TPA: ABC transporter permease [Candidatus Pullichristensenella excrementigallinarum]|uniref:ABC transporter permease n=1 Tax=Candidatus Pullichristensenella excrementigallinarum TaxID=2840907 RepID=A0A9D1IDP0_9FIRM|nr:ABC transporter permease [Candidatus Pullichristensenella excrementigallinarum]